MDSVLREKQREKYDVRLRNLDGQEGRLDVGFAVSSACGEGSGTAVLMLGVMLGLISIAGTSRRRRRCKK